MPFSEAGWVLGCGLRAAGAQDGVDVEVAQMHVPAIAKMGYLGSHQRDKE